MFLECSLNVPYLFTECSLNHSAPANMRRNAFTGGSEAHTVPATKHAFRSIFSTSDNNIAF
jgi:hypothetical protein